MQPWFGQPGEEQRKDGWESDLIFTQRVTSPLFFWVHLARTH